MDEEQLTARLLTSEDLPSHNAEEALQGGVISTDKPECRDLATLLLGGAMTGTSGQAHVQAAKDATVTKVSLHSWFGTKAGTLLADIKAGGQACGSGFNAISGTTTIKITKVVTGIAMAGDENVAFTAEQELDGKKTAIEAVLTRKGTTLASFTARSTSGTTEKPTAVIEAQMNRLN